ncbi:putative Translationally-controlled tumor protein-like protein [Hypsibius exemplaris]|uniref:Translationally-controlled tumor protein homolog n=1 Tax=Hypsibius exemplaris TaxID=2072580 RepID=A0A1W0X7T9_HYPEX|nr:putative Translationally-controlled tumor protein-like protein [Hypsibius exemplaris]
MIIYKDAVTGDELFTDACKVKLVDECIYEVTGKYVTRKIGEDIVLAGANASQEEADEGTDEATESGVDVVLNNRLQEVPFLQDKKAYQGYIKDYMKALVKRVEEKNPADVEKFKANVQTAVKRILGSHANLQFYTGESMDAEKGMVVTVEYRDVDGTDTPILSFFKHGLVEEKV